MLKKTNLVIIAAITFHSAAPALAEEVSNQNRAREIYQAGVRSFDAGDYGAALVQLERSNEIFPSLRTLFSIGRCQYSLSNLPAAHRSLARYLREGGDQVPRELRQQASDLLDQIHRNLAVVNVSVNIEGAAISVDGEPLGTTPLLDPIALEPGRHVIEASLPGLTTDRREFAAHAGENISVELVIAARPQQPVQQGAGPPDIVILHDGSYVRGTISAAAMGRYVDIVLVTGETRRFAMSEVSYAGSADESPSSQGLVEETTGSQPAQVSVRFEGDPPGISFYRLTQVERGPFAHQRRSLVCTAPCDALMEPGSHSFALGISERSLMPQRPLVVEQPVTVTEGLTLVGRITDNRTSRRNGAILVATGGVLGIGFIAAALATSLNISVMSLIEEDESSFNHVYFWPLFSSGVLSLVIFEVLGIRLVRQRDVASIGVR